MAVLLHLQMGRGNRRSWVQGEESLIPFVAKNDKKEKYEEVHCNLAIYQATIEKDEFRHYNLAK